MTALIGSDQYIRMPWKNGMGVTWELARKDLADASGFLWRISIASVTADGPFSLYPGYGRIISTLEGEGMVLTADGRPSREIRRFDLFAFSGSDRMHCALINGPIRDFNVIHRPDLCRVRARWLRADPLARVMSSASTIFFYAADAVSLSPGAPVAAGSAFLIENEARKALDWTVANGHEVPNAAFCCVEIEEEAGEGASS